MSIKRIGGLCLLVAGLVSGCNNVKKEVVATYDNKEPKVVQYLAKENGKEVRVKEEMFYENGTLRYSGKFENEKPTGEWKYFYDDGSLFAKTTFAAENQKGSNWHVYDPSGKPLFAENGYLRAIKFDQSNCPSMLVNTITDTISQMELYPNFDVKLSGALVHGKQNGRWAAWFENGNLQSEGFFVDGVLNGIQKVHYENGNLYYSGGFKNGLRIGKWEFFDEDGTLLDSRNYDISSITVVESRAK